MARANKVIKNCIAKNFPNVEEAQKVANVWDHCIRDNFLWEQLLGLLDKEVLLAKADAILKDEEKNCC